MEGMVGVGVAFIGLLGIILGAVGFLICRVCK